MKVGAAEIDITPTPGIELSGFAIRVQPSTGVHDHLMLRALYLEQDGVRVLWVHADLIGFDESLANRLKAAIGARTGLFATGIVLSATHTHSGPPTIDLIGCGSLTERTIGYLDRLTEAAVLAADAALVSAEEGASVIEGISRCTVAVDRRHPGRPPLIDEVVVLGFKRGTEYLAVLANYAVHPVSLGAHNQEISADLMGVAARRLAEVLPGSPVVLLTNGACGDLNPPSETREFGPCRRYGEAIAEATLAALQNARPVEDRLSSVSARLRVPVEGLDEEGVRGRVLQLGNRFRGNGDWELAARGALVQWERKMLLQTPLQDLTLMFQAVRIGGRIFACFGGEALSMMSLELRRRGGSRITTVGYANGDIGYLAPEAAHDEGGYEVDLAYVYYGTPPPARGSFEAVLDQALEVMGATLDDRHKSHNALPEL